MLNGLFLGIRDTIPLMQAYQIMSPIRLLKCVIVFPNNCTKLGNGHKGTKQAWVLALPQQYARADNNSRFLAQVANPQAFVIAS
jgi:hypothetical protein